MRKRIWLFVCLFFALYLIFVFNYLSRPQIITWDEAGFVGTAYKFHQLFRAADWSKIISLIKSEVYYPFFQGLFLGLVTLPFEFTIDIVKGVCLLLFAPTLILIWQIGKSLSKSKAVAFLSVGLVVTSPFIPFFFTVVLREGMGLLLALLTIWLYFLGRSKKSSSAYVFPGVFLTALSLTKYTFGLMVIAALGTESLITLVFDKKYPKKELFRGLFFLFLIPASILGVWVFAVPGNLAEIIRNLKNVPDFPTTIMGHLLYYPIELAVSYSLSWPIFVLVTVGFFAALIVGRKDYRVRVLALYFLINFFLAEKIVFKNQSRYILTSVPFFFMVGSLGLVNLFSKLRKKKFSSLQLGFLIPLLIVMGGVVIKDLFSFPFLMRAVPTHAFGTALFYEQDYQKTDMFDYDRRNWARVMPPEGSERIENIFRFIFENIDPYKSITWVGRINEVSYYLFEYNLGKEREKRTVPTEARFSEYFITIEVLEGGRFDTLDYRLNNKSEEYLTWKYLSDPTLIVVSQKKFSYLGAVVTVLGRK